MERTIVQITLTNAVVRCRFTVAAHALSLTSHQFKSHLKCNQQCIYTTKYEITLTPISTTREKMENCKQWFKQRCAGNASFTITSPYKCSLISNDKIKYIYIRFHKLLFLSLLLLFIAFQLNTERWLWNRKVALTHPHILGVENLRCMKLFRKEKGWPNIWCMQCGKSTNQTSDGISSNGLLCQLYKVHSSLYFMMLNLRVQFHSIPDMKFRKFSTSLLK